ncbi:MAG: hypothetical protein LBQ74_13035 [Prevotella sp.]|jgi:hypothetical protein|nr:hypothetical protein [Prevotella sp.]
MFGLSEPVIIRATDSEDDMTAYPAVIDNDGECQYVFADDNYPFGVYHRLLSSNYSQKKGSGRKDLDVRIDEVLLICWGFRNQVQMDSVTLENQIIVPSFPTEILIVQTIFDRYAVFNSEFKKIAYNLAPELFLFSVKYRMQYVFDRECIEV